MDIKSQDQGLTPVTPGIEPVVPPVPPALPGPGLGQDPVVSNPGLVEPVPLPKVTDVEAPETTPPPVAVSETDKSVAPQTSHAPPAVATQKAEEVNPLFEKPVTVSPGAAEEVKGKREEGRKLPKKMIAGIASFVFLIIVSAVTGWTLYQRRVEPIAPTAPASQPKAQAANLEPVAYWKLDEVSGNSATDSSVNGNTGTVSNATIVDGRFGKARSFDHGRITVPDSAWVELGSSDFTINLWVKFDSLREGTVERTLRNALISKWGTRGNFDWSLDVGVLGTGPIDLNTYSLRFHCAQNASEDREYNQLWHPDLNTWYQVTIVRSGSTISHYVNSQRLGSNLRIDGSCNDSSQPLLFGTAVNDNDIYYDLAGTLDEICVFKRALAPAEIPQGCLAGVPTATIPIPTPTPTGTLTPTPTPTPVTVSAHCESLIGQVSNGAGGWISKTDAEFVAAARPGDRVRFMCTGAKSSGNFTKAAFFINNVLHVDDVVRLNDTQFVVEYTIGSAGALKVESVLLHDSKGWVD